MFTLNCCGRLIHLTTPVVMGILNATPDSFYDGGKFNNETDSRRHVEEMLDAGASMIDVGAISSRPGSVAVSETEEWARLEPVLKMLAKYYPQAIVSVDTFRASIAGRAIDEGACIINDIYAGADAAIMQVAGQKKAPYIMMHMQGTPADMQNNPSYTDVTLQLLDFFTERLKIATGYGLRDVIIDPGFGFGKTSAHNFQLLNELDHFKVLLRPVMAGLSRKSMINKTLDIKAQAALNGTTVLNTVALMKGVNILRVHDVKEAVEAVKLVSQMTS